MPGYFFFDFFFGFDFDLGLEAGLAFAGFRGFAGFGGALLVTTLGVGTSRLRWTSAKRT